MRPKTPMRALRLQPMNHHIFLDSFFRAATDIISVAQALVIPWATGIVPDQGTHAAHSVSACIVTHPEAEAFPGFPLRR
jgi:hypothetical protein